MKTFLAIVAKLLLLLRSKKEKRERSKLIYIINKY